MSAAFLFPPRQLDELERRLDDLEGRVRAHDAQKADDLADRLHREIERGAARGGVDHAGASDLSAALDRRIAALETAHRQAVAEELRRELDVELLHDLRHRTIALENQAQALTALQARTEAIEARERDRDEDAERRRMDQMVQALERRTAALEARERAHAAQLRELEAERRELEAALDHLHSVLIKRRSGAAAPVDPALQGAA